MSYGGGYGAPPRYGNSPLPTGGAPPPQLGRGEFSVGSQTNDRFWYSNLAVVNPTDYWADLADPRAREPYVDCLLNERFVIRVCPGTTDEATTPIPRERGATKAITKPIFFSSVMRDYMQLSMFHTVRLRRYQPQGEEIAKMEVEVKFLAQPVENPGQEPLDGDLLADSMLSVFDGQIMQPGTMLAHYYEHETEGRKVPLRLKITVRNAETYVPSANSEKPGGTTSRDPMKRGRLTKDTIIEVQRGDNFPLRLTPSSKAVKSIMKTDISFESMGIGGLDEQFNQIFRRAFASRTFPPGLVQKMGIQHVKGILLYGPPGTGKTLIARQIGKALDAVEPKIVNGPEILNKYVGASEENIRKLFADAEAEYKAQGEDSQLHIIIFDELDAICKQRGGKSDNTGVGDSVVNQLLSKMDGVDQLNNILIIGMTNRMDMIDEALLRPGRLEVHIEIALPDEAGRRQILTIHTNKMRKNNILGHDVDIPELASLTKNFSGAEIEGLVKSATSFAFNRHTSLDKKVTPDDFAALRVTRADFLAALEEVHPAFGVAEEDFAACTTGGIIRFSPHIDSILAECRLFVEQVRNSTKTPLVSVLMHGPPSAGKTALAATVAMRSQFPFVKLVSPESMLGFSEHQKIAHLTKVFTDAYRSPLNIVVVDNVERILDWVPIGPRFSNAVLQTLVVLLRKPPPKGRRLLILATTTERSVLDSLDLLHSFDAEIAVPNVRGLDELRYIMRELGLFDEREQEQVLGEIRAVTRSEELNVGVKKILMAAETARQDEGNRVGRFASVLQKAVVDMGAVAL